MAPSPRERPKNPRASRAARSTRHAGTTTAARSRATQAELDAATLRSEQAFAARERADTLYIKALTRQADAEADVFVRAADAEAASAAEARIFAFSGLVDDSSTAQAMHVLGEWSRRAPGADIRIVFNTEGGSVLDGLAFYDFLTNLRSNGHHVTTAAIGMAASMGAVLLQAGDRRVVGANAHLLIHEIASGIVGTVSEIDDRVAFTKRLQQQLLEILAARSTLGKPAIEKRWKRKDWWLNAQEAVELGFADAIE